MNIAIDIDGTLTIETGGFGPEIYQQRTPRWDIINLINYLFNSGQHKIIIWTARYIEDKEDTINWLKKYDIHYHQLIFNKLKYDVLLDDLVYNVNFNLNKFKEVVTCP